MLGSLVFAFLNGCTTQAEIDAAHFQGTAAGLAAGQAEGRETGYRDARGVAFDRAYRETMDALRAEGKVERGTAHSLLTLAAFGGFWLMGFAAQWVVFGVLRGRGVLVDVDALLLPPEIGRVGLREFGEDDEPIVSGADVTRLLTVILVGLMTAITAGCGRSTDAVWREAYQANRQARFFEGWREGKARGSEEGAELGRSAAVEAARHGFAWEFHAPVAGWGFLIGLAAGVSFQYGVLLYSRWTGLFPEAAMMLFVPGARGSLAYRVFDRKRALLLRQDEDEALDRLEADQEIRLEQMRAASRLLSKKLEAASSLEELRDARVLELARAELSRIVEAIEGETEERGRTLAAPLGRPVKMVTRLECPHCGRRLAYNGTRGGKVVSCPHDGCGRELTVPRLS